MLSIEGYQLGLEHNSQDQRDCHFTNDQHRLSAHEIEQVYPTHTAALVTTAPSPLPPPPAALSPPLTAVTSIKIDRAKWFWCLRYLHIILCFRWEHIQSVKQLYVKWPGLKYLLIFIVYWLFLFNYQKLNISNI